MKKSVFTFGLLMSSLVMLSAMPLLNNNISAMAQGYNGDSYYSQYPTDDKKYECRTGPFEGFFVGSVEFCKHVKFDKDNDRKDIRDNRTGSFYIMNNITHHAILIFISFRNSQRI